MLATLLTLALAAPPAAESGPWRLGDALDGPLRLSLEHRSRFSGIDNQFRASAPGRDLGYSMRTLVQAEFEHDWFVAVAEMIDARFYGSDDNSPIDSGIVDPFDVLQANVGVRLSDAIGAGDALYIRLGRLTKDFGSRRLMARNRFRNTILQFDGLDVVYTSPEKDRVEAFAVLPVELRPDDPSRARDNVLDRNTSSLSQAFWGLSVRTRPFEDVGTVQAYLLGLHENDGGSAPTRNRQLFTTGARWRRRPARGAVDVDLETILQFGRSRATTSPTAPRLDHRAFFVHAEVGYTLDHPSRWRAELSFEHASGDADPDDGTFGRFDDLYGVIRPEYGPTGLYAITDRQNVMSPAVRFGGRIGRVRLKATYRALWIAQARDVWTNAGLRDPTGASGRFLGHQGELFLRVPILPGNVTVDAGVVGLYRRDRLESADPASPVYGFVDLLLQI